MAGPTDNPFIRSLPLLEAHRLYAPRGPAASPLSEAGLRAGNDPEGGHSGSAGETT